MEKEHYTRIPMDGYCKVDNANRVIEALFYDDEKWGREFIRLECRNQNCPHAGDCYLVKKALEMED